MVLPELQALASGLGISGTGRMRKSQLIAAIQEKQGVVAEPAAEAKPAAGAAPVERPTRGRRERSRSTATSAEAAGGPVEPVEQAAPVVAEQPTLIAQTSTQTVQPGLAQPGADQG